MINKTLKQYFSLRGLLARRLRDKKREIEAIKAKNRFFVSLYGSTVDLSFINFIEKSGNINEPNVLVLQFRDEKHDLVCFIKAHKDDKILTDEFFRASEQLKQLKAYDK